MWSINTRLWSHHMCPLNAWTTGQRKQHLSKRLSGAPGEGITFFLDPSDKIDISRKFISLNRHKSRSTHRISFSIPSALCTRHSQDTEGKASPFFSQDFQDWQIHSFLEVYQPQSIASLHLLTILFKSKYAF